jgi:hypothetical protein
MKAKVESGKGEVGRLGKLTGYEFISDNVSCGAMGHENVGFCNNCQPWVLFSFQFYLWKQIADVRSGELAVEENYGVPFCGHLECFLDIDAEASNVCT